MGCVFLWIHFTVIHSFQSNFRSVLKTQAHESSLRVLIWIFLSCYIRHLFTIPKGLLSVLYSNGLARYPSPWHCPWPWYLPSRICLRPRLVLVLQTPLFRVIPRSYGRKDKCGTFSRVLSWVGCFSGGVVVVSLAYLICPLGHCPTNTCSLLSRIPYSTWPSLPLYIRGSPWSYGREVEVRHLPPSTLFSVRC